ncbi:MAG TPA: nicotinate-nucleotide adenylyltransferase [Nitrospiraceae bacterium]|nr:nicotinate-nucleotide adenylyltransferase [Nitrospiraceae bacterium]
MKIGLLGGTFNPIHRCHLQIAAYTRDQLGLDRIIFIPTGDPPHKSSHGLAPSHHRLEMVKLAIAGEPSFDVSDVEIRRPVKSYSIDTVREFSKQLGSGAELYFLIGLDAFLELGTWKDAAALLRTCHFVVLARPGSSFLSLADMPLLPKTDREILTALDTQRGGRADIPIPGGGGLILLRMPPCDAAASVIRRRLTHQLPVSNLLPPPVESYIMRQNLYQEASDHTGV